MHFLTSEVDGSKTYNTHISVYRNIDKKQVHLPRNIIFKSFNMGKKLFPQVLLIQI